jgi:hypothetical protein
VDRWGAAAIASLAAAADEERVMAVTFLSLRTAENPGAGTEAGWSEIMLGVRLCCGSLDSLALREKRNGAS